MTGEVKQGRPPVSDEERCRNVTVRLDGAARAALAALREHYGIGYSATVRRVLIERARRVAGRGKDGAG